MDQIRLPRKKTGGRTKGTPNRITSVLKYQLSKILASEYDRIPELLQKLPTAQRLHIILRISRFILPEPTSGLDQFDMISTQGGNWNYRPAEPGDYEPGDYEPEPES
jgi:hypothetical protein